MSDISASERRLSAALDRIDRLLELAPRPQAEDHQRVEELTRQLHEAQDQNSRLSRELEAAALPAASPGDRGAELADLQTRLDAATEQAARLAAANEDLASANRNLIDAQATGGIGEDEVRDALEAEIQALRAARAAEMGQMSEIMTELERLLAEDEARAKPSEPVEVAAEVAGDAGGLPEVETVGQQPGKDGGL